LILFIKNQQKDTLTQNKERKKERKIVLTNTVQQNEIYCGQTTYIDNHIRQKKTKDKHSNVLF